MLVTGHSSLVTGSETTARLRRDLTLWDLIFYGLVIVQPIAPVPLFGITQVDSRGHTVLTILIGMVAMLFTAVSYGRMAALYPSAGSAYTYVGRGLNPYLGFLAGWGMLLCYLMFPLINIIYIAVTLHRLFPVLPYSLGAALCATAFTFLNLRGIRSTRRANQVLLTVMCAVIGSFMVLAIRYLLHAQGWGGLLSAAPFFDRHTFDLQSLRTATAFSILTYLGFDGVTTLAEDVQNPRRSVPLAAVLTVLLTGAFGSLQVYLGQRVWPDYHRFPNVETAFMDVCQRVGGAVLYDAMAAILIVACFGTALTGQVSSARLLFSMGRENLLPHKVFAHLDPRRNTPAWNFWMIGLLALGGAMLLDFEHGADLLNFGSFLAFMGVNVAAFWQFYVAGHPGGAERGMGSGTSERTAALPPAVRPVPTGSRENDSAFPRRQTQRKGKKEIFRLGRLPESRRLSTQQAAEPQQAAPTGRTQPFRLPPVGANGHAIRLLADAIPPLLGLLCCLAIWWGLPAMTKIIGGSWLLLGIVVAAVATHGFRTPPPLLAPDES